VIVVVIVFVAFVVQFVLKSNPWFVADIPEQLSPGTTEPAGNHLGDASCQTSSELTIVADMVTPETVVV
jgi:hypothetical protein